MSSGDVVYETGGSEGFSVFEYHKKAGPATWEWTATLHNGDPYGPQAEVEIKGNTLGGAFPDSLGVSGKKFKITITEV